MVEPAIVDVGFSGVGWLPTYGEALGAIALTLGLVKTVLDYLKGIKLKAAADNSRESLWAKSVEVSKEVKVVADALTEHKLMVAQKYVAIEMLEHVETRLFAAIAEVAAAIRGISDRLDRNMERHTEKRP